MTKFFKNPILNKELIVTSRSAKLSIGIFIFNVIISGIGLSIFSGIVNSDSIDYSSIISIYGYLATFECVIIMLMIPILTAASIAGERERQTLDVMLTTPMSSMSIIWGKLLTAVIQVLIYAVTLLPVMSLAFIFGGLSFFNILGLFVLIAVATLLVGSIGIFCSVVTKKTITAVILSFVVIGLLMGLQTAIFGVGTVIVELYNANLYNGDPQIGFGIIPLTMLGNPVVLVGNYVVNGITGLNVGTIADSLSSQIPGFVMFVTKHWTIFSSIVSLLFTYLITLFSAKLLRQK